MTWFKVDDGLHSHRKVMSIRRKDRASAMGLWCLAGSWAADSLSDGFIPAYMVRELGCTERQAQCLVEARLWITADGGYQFHAWNEPGRQPTRAKVEGDRETERKRKAEYRAKQESQRDNTVSPDGTPPGVPVGVRTPRPDPTRPLVDPGNQSSPHRTGENGDRLNLAKIAKVLHSDQPWAARVADQVLDRAPEDVHDRTAYVMAAIRDHLDEYRPTPTPPRWPLDPT